VDGTTIAVEWAIEHPSVCLSVCVVLCICLSAYVRIFLRTTQQEAI